MREAWVASGSCHGVGQARHFGIVFTLGPDLEGCGSLPGSSVHGILQAKVLEWGAIAFSKLVLTSSIRTGCSSTLAWRIPWTGEPGRLLLQLSEATGSEDPAQPKIKKLVMKIKLLFCLKNEEFLFILD